MLDLIDRVVPGVRTLLDIACGTGSHAKFLKDYYAVDSIDLNNRNAGTGKRTRAPSGKAAAYTGNEAGTHGT